MSPLDRSTRGMMPRLLSDRSAVTVIELLIALSISALLLVAVETALFTLFRIGPRSAVELELWEDLQQAGHWVERDATRALTFTPGSNPDYGVFSWTEYSAPAPVSRTVTYKYSGTNLLREERVDGTLVASRAIAQNIRNYGDVTFTYDNVNKKVDVAIGGTKEGPLGDLAFSNTVKGNLRAQSESEAPTPGPAPTPTPVPGAVKYYCGSNPTLLTGSLVSGGCAQMQADDTAYFITRSSTGATREITWEVLSQTITQANVTGVTVVFIGRVTRANVTEQLFVYGSGGYPAVPDLAHTYTAQDTDTTVSFTLEQAQLDYLNTLTGTNKKIRLKLNAFYTLGFDHSTELLEFSVS